MNSILSRCLTYDLCLHCSECLRVLFGFFYEKKMLPLKVINCPTNKRALYLQCVGDRQTHEARIETLLPSHGKQCSKQHHAVPNELDAHAKPPVSQQGCGSNKSPQELRNRVSGKVPIHKNSK